MGQFDAKGGSVRSRPIEVGLVALPETTPGALYGLLEVFSSVGVAWSALTGEAETAVAMRTLVIAEGDAQFTGAMGVPIAPHAAFGEIAGLDILVVPDIELTSVADPRGRWPAATAWLRERYAAGAAVCSVCSGTVLLAEAGILDGEEATSHWSATELLGAHYPKVTMRPERILLPAGLDQRIVTSGGSASWEDLALYLIARYCGAQEAVRIAKVFVFGDRSEGQLPFAAMGRPRRHEDAIVAGCQAWIAQHYAVDRPVTRMIEQSGLAARTFKRRFAAATGYTPVAYVQALRVEEAKQILETTGEPTDAVAVAVGYDDPAFFRRLFKRRTGTTPARYRLRFQAVGRCRPAPPLG